MNNDKFTHLGFWGTIIPAKSSLAVTPPDNRVLKISSASLDLKHSEKSKSSLVIVDSAKKQEFVVCTLTSRQPSSHLDLFFVPGGKITFKVAGDCGIHLTGYTTNVEDFGPGDEDESGSDLDLPRDVQDLKSIVQDLSAGEVGESDSDDAALIAKPGKAAARPAAPAAKGPAKVQKVAPAQAAKGKAKQQGIEAQFDEESDEELDAESMEVAAGLAARAKAALGDDLGEEESDEDDDEVSALPGAKRPRPNSAAPAAKKAKTDAGATPAKPAQSKQKGKAAGKGSQKPAATPAAKGASPKGPQGKAGAKAKPSQKQQTPAKPAAGAKGPATPDSGAKQAKKQQSKAKTVKCPQCPKMFANEHAVAQHAASAHKSA